MHLVRYGVHCEGGFCLLSPTKQQCIPYLCDPAKGSLCLDWVPSSFQTVLVFVFVFLCKTTKPVLIRKVCRFPIYFHVTIHRFRIQGVLHGPSRSHWIRRKNRQGLFHLTELLARPRELNCRAGLRPPGMLTAAVELLGVKSSDSSYWIAPISS